MAMKRSQQSFRAWLMQNRKHNPRVAGNAVSRCQRVERMLGIDLFEALGNDNGLEDILRRTEAAFRAIHGDNYVRAGGRSLAVAVKRYAEFIQSSPTEAWTEKRRDAMWLAFREWLECRRGLKPSTADSMVSRCWRMERMLDVSLDQVASTHRGVQELIAQLKDTMSAQANTGAPSKPVHPYYDLRAAVLHFHAFLSEGYHQCHSTPGRPDRAHC